MAHQLLKDSTFFSASRYLILGFGFVRNLLIAKFLSPADYGVWVLITLVLTYGDQIHLGLRHFGDKAIPYQRGRGEATGPLANEIYSGILFFSFSAMLLLIVFAGFARGPDAATRAGLLFAGIIIIADQVNRFYYMIMRAHNEFMQASKIESFYELWRTLFLIGGVVMFKFQGALAGLALSSLLMAIYFSWRHRASYRFNWPGHKLWDLLQRSWPLFINGLLFILLSNLDRLAAASALPSHELGLYGLVALLAAIAFNAAQAVGVVVYPRFSEQFGRHGKAQELEFFFTHVLRATSYLVPPLVAGVFLSAPFIITGFLPAYREAIPAIFLLMPGAYFFALVQLPASFLMATDHNRQYITVEAATIVVVALSYFIGLQLERSFLTVAALTAFGFFLYATSLLVVCYKIMGYMFFKLLLKMIKIYVPLVFSLIAVYVLLRFFPYPLAGTLQESLLWSLRQLALFLVLYGALFYWANLRTGYWQRLRTELSNLT